jgi:nitroreductase
MSDEGRSATAGAVLATIRTRRVTRAFEERPVAVEAILDLLEAGRWAPSGGNRRIHRFLVIRDRGTLSRLRAVSPGMLGMPAAVIAICTDSTRAAEELVQLEHDATILIDVGTAAMNMMLAAHALGLGTCPVSSFSHVAARVVLDLPPALEPELLLLLGHPARPPVAPPASSAQGRRAAALPAGLVSWERLGQAEPEP